MTRSLKLASFLWSLSSCLSSRASMSSDQFVTAAYNRIDETSGALDKIAVHEAGARPMWVSVIAAAG